MLPTVIRLLVLLCIFAAVLIAVETIFTLLANQRSTGKAINQRLKMIEHGVAREEVGNRLRRVDTTVPDWVPALFRARVTTLEKMLMAAGLSRPTSELLLMVLLAPIGLFLLMIVVLVMTGTALGGGRLFLLLGAALAIGLALPLMWLNFRATRRRKKMQEQFPVALDVFVRGLRAGHPVAAALDLLTVEMADPIGSQFGIVVDEVTYGADLRDALQAMAERWDLDDMRMFVVSLSVQNETGGNLAEILENLAKVIRERASMMMKVRALSSEGRMTALMLTVLPIFAFTMLFLAKPEFYLNVADDPAFIPSFGTLIAMYCIGVFWIRKMIDLKV